MKSLEQPPEQSLLVQDRNPAYTALATNFSLQKFLYGIKFGKQGEVYSNFFTTFDPDLFSPGSLAEIN